MTHDPRIIALAKDPRTAPVLVSIVESVGSLAETRSALELDAFGMALHERGFGWADPIGSELLTYVRSVADTLVGRRRVEHDLPMVLAALRGEPCERWSAVRVCDVLDAAQDDGLLVGEELELTQLGRAVLLVLERRQAGAT